MIPLCTACAPSSISWLQLQTQKTFSWLKVSSIIMTCLNIFENVWIHYARCVPHHWCHGYNYKLKNIFLTTGVFHFHDMFINFQTREKSHDLWLHYARRVPHHRFHGYNYKPINLFWPLVITGVSNFPDMFESKCRWHHCFSPVPHAWAQVRASKMSETGTAQTPFSGTETNNNNTTHTQTSQSKQKAGTTLHAAGP